MTLVLDVMQKWGCLEIHAEVDLEGLHELKDLLTYYEAILARVAKVEPLSAADDLTNAPEKKP